MLDDYAATFLSLPPPGAWGTQLDDPGLIVPSTEIPLIDYHVAGAAPGDRLTTQAEVDLAPAKGLEGFGFGGGE